MTEPTPKYRWRKTWEDEPDDFVGYDGDEYLARRNRPAEPSPAQTCMEQLC